MTAITQTLSLRSPSLLRKALWFDALSVAGMGLVLLLGAGLLQPLFGLEAGFLRAVAALLLTFADFIAFVASREPIARVAVRWIVALNEVWVIASFAILLFGWVQPTTLGTAFVIAQALVGGAVAAAEFVGLKREAAAA